MLFKDNGLLRLASLFCDKIVISIKAIRHKANKPIAVSYGSAVKNYTIPVVIKILRIVNRTLQNSNLHESGTNIIIIPIKRNIKDLTSTSSPISVKIAPMSPSCSTAVSNPQIIGRIAFDFHSLHFTVAIDHMPTISPSISTLNPYVSAFMGTSSRCPTTKLFANYSSITEINPTEIILRLCVCRMLRVREVV